MVCVIRKKGDRVQRLIFNTEQFVGEYIFYKIITNVALCEEKIIDFHDLSSFIREHGGGNKLECKGNQDGGWKWIYTTISGRTITVEPSILCHLIINVDFGKDGSKNFFSQIMRYVFGTSQNVEDLIQAVLESESEVLFLSIDNDNFVLADDRAITKKF